MIKSGNSRFDLIWRVWYAHVGQIFDMLRATTFKATSLSLACL
jgi:hypothetical protein